MTPCAVAIVTALETPVPAVTVSEKVITISAPIKTLVALLAIENVAVSGKAWAGETAPTTVSTATASDAPSTCAPRRTQPTCAPAVLEFEKPE